MPFKGKIYWAFIVAVGAAVLASSLAGWHPRPETFWKLGIYALGALITAALKFKLPGVMGTVSMNSIFMLLAVLDLDLGAAILIGASSAALQVLMRAKNRPKAEQVIFNAFAMAIPVAAADLAVHLPVLNNVDPTGCIPVLVAALVLYLVNTWIVSGILAAIAGKNIFSVWRESFMWNFAHALVGGAIAGAIHLTEKYVGWQALILWIPPLYLIFRSYKLNLKRMEDQERHAAEMSKLHWRTIEALALAIDAKDDTTAAHLRRVKIYATELGKELRLTELEAQALDAAALLHDIGKLAVPEYIISKPGRLTPEEFEKMKIHPVAGAEILARVQFPYPVVPIVRTHHEKWDGTGYPDGLKGEKIPIGSRILAAVDCLDALASNRQYRRAMPLDKAMEVVASESGKAFDPHVVAILQRRYRELEGLAKAETAEVPEAPPVVTPSRETAPANGFVTQSARVTTGARRMTPALVAGARREFSGLVEVLAGLGGNVTIEEALALLAARIQSIIECDALVVFGCEKGTVVPKFIRGESHRLFASLKIPVGQGLSGWVAETQRPILNGNPSVEPGYLNDPRNITHLRSALSVPLLVHGEVAGVLSIYSLQADAFNTDDQRILTAIADGVAEVLQQERGQAPTVAGGMDEATGLPNARALFEHLENAMSAGVQGPDLSLMVIDLVGFKLANELFGHRAGNQLISSFAEELRSFCRDRDFVARLGGDEFALLIENAEPEAIAGIQSRIQSMAAETSLRVCGRSFLSAVAGVARFPEDGYDVDTLMTVAQSNLAGTRRHQREVQPEPRPYLVPTGTGPLRR